MGLNVVDQLCVIAHTETVKPVGFEWDEAKAAANLRKHGVSFEEAASAFADPKAVLAEDGSGRGRFILIGFSAFANLLTVVHVEQDDDEQIRIISAWRATAEERQRYAEG